MGNRCSSRLPQSQSTLLCRRTSRAWPSQRLSPVQSVHRVVRPAHEKAAQASNAVGDVSTGVGFPTNVACRGSVQRGLRPAHGRGVGWHEDELDLHIEGQGLLTDVVRVVVVVQWLSKGEVVSSDGKGLVGSTTEVLP